MSSWPLTPYYLMFFNDKQSFLFMQWAVKNTTVRICCRLIDSVFLLLLFSKFNGQQNSFSTTLLLFFAFAAYAHRSVWFAGGSLMVGFTHFYRRFSRYWVPAKKWDKLKKPFKPPCSLCHFSFAHGNLFFYHLHNPIPYLRG